MEVIIFLEGTLLNFLAYFFHIFLSGTQETCKNAEKDIFFYFSSDNH